MPRDGSASVTFDASIRLDRVMGVSFVGFWTFPNSLVLTGVQAEQLHAGDYAPVDAPECRKAVRYPGGRQRYCGRRRGAPVLTATGGAPSQERA